MFGLGAAELIFIAALVILFFGGKKLPEIGSGLGKGIASFKKGLGEIDNSSDSSERIEK